MDLLAIKGELDMALARLDTINTNVVDARTEIQAKPAASTAEIGSEPYGRFTRSGAVVGEMMSEIPPHDPSPRGA
jgi:hypothetical protein